MKIGELAKRSGLSAHTIRYYERIGLFPFADRDDAGRRDYDISILGWVEFLGHLKATGMTLAEMRRYATLRDMGDGSADDRRDLLVTHREKVRAHVKSLQANLHVLDTKIASYEREEKE